VGSPRPRRGSHRLTAQRGYNGQHKAGQPIMVR
jgi:hypothetical protein